VLMSDSVNGEKPLPPGVRRWMKKG